MRAHAAAAGAAVGALVMVPVPLLVGVGAVILGLARRTVLAVAFALAVVCSMFGARALDGLDAPPSSAVDEWVTLTSDPRPYGSFGVRAAAVWQGRRVSVTAHGPTAGRFDDALAGEQVHVRGRFRPVGTDDEWARWRHEVGTINASEIAEIRAGAPVARLANAIRRALTIGAESLDVDDRAVFLGMVIGDDRGQSAVTADDFRAAGLGHLLVVSGQNVAFVIAVVMPLVAGLRPGPRLLVLVAALGFFALLTRFEPSVLRAVGMAAVGVGANAVGTAVDGRRALSAAIAALLVVDPFLVHVLAFQLSAAATAGIVWLSQPLADRLRGPMPFRVAVATTAAAQLAVAPLLVFTFGPMPLASLPANLLAGPASGPIMIWGCTGGLLAGLVGGPVATVLHTPTAVLVGWVRWVAHVAAVAPAATLGPISLTVLGLAVAAIAGGRRRLRVPAGAAIGAVVLAAAAAVPAPPAGFSHPGAGITLFSRAGAAIVVLDDPSRPADIVERLREIGVRRLDGIVAVDGDAADAFATMALVERYGPVPILAPPLHRVPGASTLHIGHEARFAGITVTAVDEGGAAHLDVDG